MEDYAAEEHAPNVLLSQREVNREFERIRRQGAPLLNSTTDDKSVLQQYLGRKQKHTKTERGGPGQFPLITQQRVGSSNYLQEIVSMYRGTSTSAVVSSDEESPRALSRDPFMRNNKLKSKSQGVKKPPQPRYSLESGFSSMMSTANHRIQVEEDLYKPRIMIQEKKLTATLEEVNVFDLVNKGKLSSQNQLKPISTKNLNRQLVNKAIFKNSENVLNSHRSQHRSTLPSGVMSNTEKENIISINAQRKRKISVTGGHDTIDDEFVSLHVSREGPRETTIDIHETEKSVLSRRVSASNSMMLRLLVQLFEARNEDMDIVRKNMKQMEQFIKRAELNSIRRKLIMKDMGFSAKSSVVLSQLIRVGANLAKWTHIDLSMNKLCTNFDPLVRALKVNTQLVSLRLSNNELGANHINLLKQLITEHPSITDIDLSNDDSNQNKNKLGNAGLEALIEGILDSSQSVITMINMAQNNIQGQFPETFNMLKVLLTVKSEQILSLNLSDNDLGGDFISILGAGAISNLKELQLSNTRLTKKSLNDLSDMMVRHKFQLLHLDISSNQFNAETIFKFFNSLKNGMSPLKKLNLSRNDLSMGEQEEGPPGAYYSIFEQFISLNRTLEELILNDCRLGPDGAAIVGRGLRKNQKLQRLHLSNNKIGDRGVFSILEGVLDNVVTSSSMQGLLVVAPITELDLSKNEIELKTETSKSTLCNLLLEKKSNLGSLSLRDNLIRDDAADVICLALKQNLSKINEKLLLLEQILS